MEAITLLMEDLDRFYGATDVEPPSTRVSQVEAALFREPRAAYVLLVKAGSSSAWRRTHFFGRLLA
jgi:hypothetical protein